MCRPEHRRAAERRGLRTPSDLSDAEWDLVAPLIPPARRGGRPRKVDVREVLNATFHVPSTGCQCNALPSDLPPRSTVRDNLDLREWGGTTERIHPEPYVRCREQAGREASPTTAIVTRSRVPDIDARSARGAVEGGSRSVPGGYDAGKKVPGRKRHVLVDTLGLLLNVDVHPAQVQDRDGAGTLLCQARRRFPPVGRIVGDVTVG